MNGWPSLRMRTKEERFFIDGLVATGMGMGLEATYSLPYAGRGAA
jgi:hypothetical protein